MGDDFLASLVSYLIQVEKQIKERKKERKKKQLNKHDPTFIYHPLRRSHQ